jgi:hypothetical protein
MTSPWLNVSPPRSITRSISSATEGYSPPSKALARSRGVLMLHVKTPITLSVFSPAAFVAPMEISTEQQREFELSI